MENSSKQNLHDVEARHTREDQSACHLRNLKRWASYVLYWREKIVMLLRGSSTSA